MGWSLHPEAMQAPALAARDHKALDVVNLA